MADVAKRRREHFMEWMAVNGLKPLQVANAAGITPSTLYSYTGDAKAAGSKPTQSLRGDTEALIAMAFKLPVEAIFGFTDELADEEPNNLRAWRKYRGLSKKDAARRLGTTEQVISFLESGGASLSLKWLYKFGDAYGVSAGWLADHRPEDVPFESIRALPPERPLADMVADDAKEPRRRRA